MYDILSSFSASRQINEVSAMASREWEVVTLGKKRCCSWIESRLGTSSRDERRIGRQDFAVPPCWSLKQHALSGLF